MRKLAVTTTKKSHATIALAWLRTNVSQRCFGSGSRRGPPLFRYFPTVRGDTRIPSFIFSSLAMRSSPQMGFSAAIFRIRSRRSPGKRGLPVGWDFQRQKSRNPLRCQRSSVSAFTSRISFTTGYPLDSAGPNSLWLGAHLDHRLISSRRSVDGLLHEPEKQFPAALRCPAVEAECELVKVAWQLPGSHSALMGSEQPSLQ